MDNLILSSATIGIVISLLAYEIGLAAQRKWKLAILNPLLISIALVIVFLVVFHVDYDSYNMSAKYLSYLLTPATVCLAIPLYLQLDLLKKTSRLLKNTNSAMSKLAKLVEQIPQYEEGRDRAVYCREKIVPGMEALRQPVDELEMLVDKEMWPMPSYGDLIFEV